MTQPPVSVVIVSWQRGPHLRTCLTGVAQLAYPAFEIVVVADPDGVQIAQDVLGDGIKTVTVDQPNISAARNAGIAAAGGDIIAFIDDDAVPEPTWLIHLTAPFSDPQVVMAGGHVLGRNGITLQWGAAEVDRMGYRHALPDAGDQPILRGLDGDRILKLEGTNMAFRAKALCAVGGFDPGIAFYMDETDLIWRMAAQGGTAALVPLAVVHHGFAPSAQRRADRMPRDLWSIGASTARFLGRHAPERADTILAEVRTAQRQRLVQFMVQGKCLPSDIAPLLERFDAGAAKENAQSHPFGVQKLGDAQKFRAFPDILPQNPPVVVWGWAWQSASLAAKARLAVTQGRRVSVYQFTPTGIFHKIHFMSDGYWLQTGGLFGKSDRRDPIWRPWRLKARALREFARVKFLRDTDLKQPVGNHDFNTNQCASISDPQGAEQR